MGDKSYDKNLYQKSKYYDMELGQLDYISKTNTNINIVEKVSTHK